MKVKMVVIAVLALVLTGCSTEGLHVPTSPEPGRSKETNTALIEQNVTGVFCSQVYPIDAYPGRNCVPGY